MNREELRKLAIALLDDPDGINHQAWCILSDILANNSCVDIIKEVTSARTRYYLNEDHSFQTEKPKDHDGN